MNPFVHGFLDEMQKLATRTPPSWTKATDASKKRMGFSDNMKTPQFSGTQRDQQKPEGKIPMPSGMDSLSWESRTPDISNT